MMKKKICSYVLILVLISALFSQSGCKKKKDNGLVIYYMNQQSTKLLTDSFFADSKNEEEVLVEMFEKLQSKPSDVDMFEAIPDSVKVLGSDIDTQTKTLSVNFSKEYYDIERSTEILTRAAVVLTVTQLDSVNYVDFLVDGARLVDSDNHIVGFMSENSFADISAGSKITSSTKSDFTIYFANTDYSKLVPVKHTGRYLADASLETYIIKEIIDGPDSSEYNATISGETNLVSAVTNDNVCYVIFGDDFETLNASYNSDILIYSIVNSLVELPYIDSVRISTSSSSVDGSNSFNGISLEDNFTKNPDIIEGDLNKN